MRITPTTLQWEDNLRVDDYQRKQIKKAEPNDPAFEERDDMVDAIIF